MSDYSGQLRPCPCCGSEGIGWLDSLDIISIYCGECAIEITEERAQFSAGAMSSFDEILTAWNTRPEKSLSDIKKEIDRKVDIINENIDEFNREFCESEYDIQNAAGVYFNNIDSTIDIECVDTGFEQEVGIDRLDSWLESLNTEEE